MILATVSTVRKVCSLPHSYRLIFVLSGFFLVSFICVHTPHTGQSIYLPVRIDYRSFGGLLGSPDFNIKSMAF